MDPNNIKDDLPKGIILIEKEAVDVQLTKIFAWLVVMAIFVIFLLHYTNSIDQLEVFQNKK